MQYIIMCGGPTLDEVTPRPLRVVNGEVLIERTIRLLRCYGVTDIAISTTDDRFKKYGVPLLKHDNYIPGKEYHWLHCFYPTTRPVCYIYGDVYYSPYAIQTIVTTHRNDIEFFASAPPFSPYYTKHSAEPFAFKVVDHKRFRECINKTLALNAQHKFKREAISWELWQVICGTRLNHINYTNYVVINDYTADVDSDAQGLLLEQYLKK